MLDLFGASTRVARTFIRGGYAAVSFDIKLSPKHDITCAFGFRVLCTMAMQKLICDLLIFSSNIFKCQLSFDPSQRVANPGALSNQAPRMPTG